MCDFDGLFFIKLVVIGILGVSVCNGLILLLKKLIVWFVIKWC